MTQGLELRVRDGDGDATRTGYWLVTGPQPEEEAYATVELSRIVADDLSARMAFRWYLHRRTGNTYNSAASYMETVAYGESADRDAAVAEVRLAWAEHIGTARLADDDATAQTRPYWRS